jgi:hypothetical protein
MMSRLVQLGLCSLALLAFIATAEAQEKKSHEGTVVSAAAGQLVMTDKDGKEHSHVVPAGTKVTIDGKPGKLEDLKKGDKITVTMEGTRVVEISKGAKPKANP